MYILYDLGNLYEGYRNGWPSNPMTFDGQAALMRFWKQRIGSDFSDLNVTGKDISMLPDAHWWTYDQDGNPTYHQEYGRYLKRYMVTDQNGRHVDIRTWEMQPQEVRRPSNWWYAMTLGSKRHWHRSSGPSMWRGTMRQALSDRTVVLNDDNGEIAIQTPPVRSKALMTLNDHEDFYEKRWYTTPSRSWKLQSKARRQHAKHKKAGPGKSRAQDREDLTWLNLAADGFPVDPRLLENAA